MSLDPLGLFIVCLGLGGVVGVLAGLLGIGGGLVVVPALVWLLPQAGFSADIVMPVALATSLSSIVLTAGSSARSHIRQGNVDYRLVAILAPGVMMGGGLGSVLVGSLPVALLPKLFAVIVFGLAFQMMLSLRVSHSRGMPSRPFMLLSGCGIGTVASLAGIGGGGLMVPFLNRYGVEMRQAIGCASLTGGLIALSGMVGLMLAGANSAQMPNGSLGYVYLPALIGIVLTSVVTTRLGVRLASTLPTQVLKKVFITFLLMVSIKMYVG